MYVDSFLEFADETALDTSGTDTDLIGDVINLEDARDIGQGEQLYLVIQVTTEVDSAADGASVEFVLASDAQAAIATDGTATEHLSTGAIAEANLGAGKQFIYHLPLEGNEYEQYLGLLTKTTGEAVTAGAINAFITKDAGKYKAYPNNYATANS